MFCSAKWLNFKGPLEIQYFLSYQSFVFIVEIRILYAYYFYALQIYFDYTELHNFVTFANYQSVL